MRRGRREEERREEREEIPRDKVFGFKNKLHSDIFIK